MTSFDASGTMPRPPNGMNGFIGVVVTAFAASAPAAPPPGPNSPYIIGKGVNGKPMAMPAAAAVA